MNETVTDIYFYNFIFKVLVFARHQAEPLLFNCQELWWDFLSSTKSLVFGSINTFMLYQQILRLFSPFGNFLKIISFLKLLSHGCMYTIRINFQVTQSSSSDGGFFMVVIFSFLPQCLQNLNNFHFWNICLITKQQITWFIVWELIWQWEKTQIYQEKCILRDKFWLIVKAEKCTAS